MGDLIRWIVVVSVKVGFWSAVIFTFLPLLTLIVSSILIGLNGTVIQDLYFMLQMYLPFNLNVILIWSLTLSTAFGVWWVANFAYEKLNKLVGQQF